jgi:hypothetical protein
MIQIFINTHDDIFKAVKRESSYLAERRDTKEGEPLFDQLVYDEEYLIQFREHFLEARAKAIEYTLAYSKTIEADNSLFETQDFDMEKDFVLYLELSDNHVIQLMQPILIKIKEFLVAYIMYRWLETKAPEAEIYFQRSEKAIKDVKSYLEKRIKPYRRKGSWF